ncbi:hypothetical protein IWX90DRAFT_173137 [Phyllosticta citrichinensis]|uniref:ribonuclease H n=1 Tax=Phyllosticta citrichinensis TaxID=1130410 RepID=A0ABR1XVL8_9PEZI
MNAEQEHTKDRHLWTTERLGALEFEKNIRTCPKTGLFFINNFLFDRESLSHNYPVIFTNGSCLDNGRRNPRAGFGIAAGTCSSRQIVMPLSDRPSHPDIRTNQRAELFGAIIGLYPGVNLLADWLEELPDRGYAKTSVVIATDSESVVNGITELLPKSKADNYTTSTGDLPRNLDLILELEERVVVCETRQSTNIRFLLVPQGANWLACGLSNSAAAMDIPRHSAGGHIWEQERKIALAQSTALQRAFG